MGSSAQVPVGSAVVAVVMSVSFGNGPSTDGDGVIRGKRTVVRINSPTAGRRRRARAEVRILWRVDGQTRALAETRRGVCETFSICNHAQPLTRVCAEVRAH
ncbi:hypothetical protein MPRF_28310 [Mycolicibacterium parafortuitum]|uniref:Uncharacterized protein n=1 Tax=Mycolicibacterium parafortuitum TaxID=39692 RepID=A0A7I7U3N5_MYCPF|nr:hypothetical protein MPRF_28310 [Mycolicibacterium parafortuitum]